MSAANTELLPCPFCGGEARLVYALDEGTKQITYTVMCMSCSTAIFRPRMSVFEWDAYDTEEEAADAWNTRHVETCHDKNGFDESLGFECTVCRTMVDSYMQTTCSDKREQFNYCPNCGAKVVSE